MVLIITLLFVLYVTVGSALGGYYYYLRRKDKNRRYRSLDMEDMGYLPVWITLFWIFVAPLAFAIYYAEKKVESEEKQ